MGQDRSAFAHSSSSGPETGAPVGAVSQSVTGVGEGGGVEVVRLALLLTQGPELRR